MIRGTTPRHTFTIPFDTSLIKTGKVVYYQDGAVVLEKEVAHCSLDGNTITIKLTQEDTFTFNCSGGYVYIQIRLLTVEGDALASDEIRVEVKRCLDSEVLK